MNSVFRRILCGFLLLAGLAGSGFAQLPASKATAVIAGRVVIGEGGAPGIEVIAVKQETGGITFSGMPTQTYNAVTEDGQPVRHASVTVSGLGGGARRTFSGRLAIITDDDGNFQADGLDPMPYQLGASAPGYVARLDM